MKNQNISFWKCQNKMFLWHNRNLLASFSSFFCQRWNSRESSTISWSCYRTTNSDRMHSAEFSPISHNHPGPQIETKPAQWNSAQLKSNPMKSGVNRAILICRNERKGTGQPFRKSGINSQLHPTLIRRLCVIYWDPFSQGYWSVNSHRTQGEPGG